MKILLASVLPVKDIRSWSGTCLAIHRQLSKNHEVSTCYNKYVHSFQKLLASISYYCHKLSGKRLNVYFNPSMARLYGYALKRAVSKIQPDLLIVIGSGTELFQYKPPCTSYLIADATFNLLLDNYDRYTNLTNRAIRISRRVEEKSLKNFTKLFYSSSWAESDVLKSFPTLKTELINFGSNLGESVFNDISIPKNPREIKLLIVGKDFHRKGIFTAKTLQNKLGCTLDIIGIDYTLDKENLEQHRQLVKLYSEAHFLVLFPTADCTPIVINEANSVGTPAIAFPTGGIPEMINQGKNGYIARDLEHAEVLIRKALQDQKSYSLLRKSTHEYYTKNLAWDVFEQKLLAQ